jgi:hypothetical protein
MQTRIQGTIMPVLDVQLEPTPCLEHTHSRSVHLFCF